MYLDSEVRKYEPYVWFALLNEIKSLLIICLLVSDVQSRGSESDVLWKPTETREHLEKKPKRIKIKRVFLLVDRAVDRNNIGQ